MSRLNFRGWDGKRMHKIVRLGIGGFSHDVWTKDPVITTPMFFKSLKIIQSTGLRDKNGVEIFEKDIAEYEDEKGVQRVVIEHFDEMAAWILMPFKPMAVNKADLLFEIGADVLCVVGNVFQHPELLK